MLNRGRVNFVGHIRRVGRRRRRRRYCCWQFGYATHQALRTLVPKDDVAVIRPRARRVARVPAHMSCARHYLIRKKRRGERGRERRGSCSFWGAIILGPLGAACSVVLLGRFVLGHESLGSLCVGILVWETKICGQTRRVSCQSGEKLWHEWIHTPFKLYHNFRQLC